MDVTLGGLDAQQRFFFVAFLRSPAEIAVQLIAQKLLHRLRPVGMPHDHQSGVLRQRFDDSGSSFRVGAHHLVRPPLVAGFVRGNEQRQVDRVFLLGIHVGDEPNTLGERNGVGERFRKVSIARELDNAQLPELKRTEGRAAIVERGLHAQHHPFQIERMPRVIVDLQADIMPVVPPHRVARRIHREDAADDRRIGLVVKVAAAVLLPFSLRITRHDRDLVETCADRALEIYPVRVRRNIVVLARSHILEFR